MEEFQTKPEIYKVARSPLLDKARAFKDLLKADNERLKKFIDEGGDPNEISMETPDPKDDSYIEMTCYKGIFEVNGQMPEEVPEIVIPETEFHPASNFQDGPN